jgi:hypothetical protein
MEHYTQYLHVSSRYPIKKGYNITIYKTSRVANAIYNSTPIGKVKFHTQINEYEHVIAHVG